MTAVDRWVLPGELARTVDPDGGRPGRRTLRDAAVDAAMFAVAVLVLLVELDASVLADVRGLPDWLRVADVVLGAAACLALWGRRRYPVATAVFASVAAAVSDTATGAVLLLLFSLAVHRGWTAAVAVAVLTFPLGVPLVVATTPAADGGPLVLLLLVVALLALVTAAGLAVRARRQLVLALRLRADDAHRDARRTERERLAREMHDVLAHRISLLSVHAGALEYRTAAAERGDGPPLTPTEVRTAVGIVRTTAHQALDELREVLGVLRREPAPPAAQDGLGALVEDARLGGQEVRAEWDGDLAAHTPDVQRTAHRLVQEGLTNARKHAAGTRVDVLVRARPAEVVVRIENPAGRTGAIPGAGTGLAGLAERVALHGGELTHATDAAGTFVLAARIPAAPAPVPA